MEFHEFFYFLNFCQPMSCQGARRQQCQKRGKNTFAPALERSKVSTSVRLWTHTILGFLAFQKFQKPFLP
jgi:hypothetical protein